MSNINFDNFSANLNYEEIELIVRGIKNEQEEKIKKDLKEKLISKFQPCIHGFTSKYSVNGFGSEDLISECNVVLLQIIEKYDTSKHTFVGYVINSMRMNILSLIAKSNRKKKKFNENKNIFYDLLKDTSIEDVEDKIQNENILKALQKIINTADEEEKFIYMNRIIRQTPLKKCARSRNIPYSTYHYHYCAFKDKLKRKLKDHLDTEE